MKAAPIYMIDREPVAVQLARRRSGLTQEQAAALVYLGAGTRWAEYENGARQIDMARYELFLLLTKQHPAFKVIRRINGQRATAEGSHSRPRRS